MTGHHTQQDLRPGHLYDVVAQLLAWGLIDDRSLVEDDIKISSVVRRNLNLRVERRQGPSLLIKQPDPTALGSRQTLQAERQFYAFCEEEPLAAPVARRMARLHPDPVGDPATVVIQLVEDSSPLWEELETRGTTTTFEGLGEALGTFYTTFRQPELADDPRLFGLGTQPPGCFFLHRPNPVMLGTLSPAEHQLLRVIQGDSKICTGLDASRRAWQIDTVIHGDVRPDNVLVLPRSDTMEILLIDWEMVRRGDPAYDVGSVLASFALFWLQSMPLSPDLEAEQRVAEAIYPMAALRPSIAAFWRAYVGAAGLTGAATGQFLERAVVYSGATLVRSAWEQSYGQRRFNSLAVLLLQLAANIFENPTRQGRSLYDLQTE